MPPVPVSYHPAREKAGSSLTFESKQRIVEELRRADGATILYDMAGIRSEIDLLRFHLSEAFPQRRQEIRFSVKANRFPPLLRWLSGLGLGAEVSSLEEFEAVRACGMTSVCATSPGLQAPVLAALTSHGAVVNLDNLSQMKDIPSGSRVGLRMCLSAQPGPASTEHPSRFGLDLADPEVGRILSRSKLRVVQIHGHSRDIRNGDDLYDLVSRVVDASTAFPSLETINLGGGMTRLYRDPDIARSAWRRCAALLQKVPPQIGIAVEPGAQLVTSHGYLGTRVVTTARRPAERQIIVVDTSRWNLVSWSPIEAIHPVRSGAKGRVTDVVGPSCYEDDFWLEKVQFPDLKRGNLIVLRGLGAYVTSMARRLHNLPVPREVLYDSSN